MSKIIFNINQPNPNDHIINKEKTTRLKNNAYPASQIKSAAKTNKKYKPSSSKPYDKDKE